MLRPQHFAGGPNDEEPSGKGLPVLWELPAPPRTAPDKEDSTRSKDQSTLAVSATHSVLLSQSEYRKLDELLPRERFRGRRRVLDALLRGPKTWREIDTLVPRGRTADTAKRYEPGGYPIWVVKRLNKQLSGILPLRIDDHKNIFQLVRIEA